MSHILTTDAVVPAKRLAYWIDMICTTYVQLECDALPGAAFGGSIVSHRLPGLELSVVRSGAQRVARTPRAISCATDDHFIVSLQTHGRAVISQDGREAVMVPGDFAIYDSTRPYMLQFSTDFEEIVLKMPRDRLRSMVRDTERLTAIAVSGRTGAGHLLVDMIGTLREEVDGLPPLAAAAVASGVVDVLAASLQSLPTCGQAKRSSLGAHHVARIRQSIDDHLRDPALTVESVAARLGMSVGHLRRVFRSEPLSPSHTIWASRLDACSRELLDPQRACVSIAEIAFGWGFNDTAHFSRAFRRRFKTSPREWRRHAEGGAVPRLHSSARKGPVG